MILCSSVAYVLLSPEASCELLSARDFYHLSRLCCWLNLCLYWRYINKILFLFNFVAKIWCPFGFSLCWESENDEPCILCLKKFESVPRVVVSWYCSSSGAYQFNGIVTNLSRELTVWTYMSQLSGSEQFSNFGHAIDFLVVFVGCSWLEELNYFERKKQIGWLGQQF